MRNNPLYKRLLSRDFSLPSVEAWVKGGLINLHNWIQDEQKFLPYVVAERHDDTVHFYYQLEGTKIIPDYLITLALKDQGFLPFLEQTIFENLPPLKSIYEKGEPIRIEQLKKFLGDLEKAYVYCEPVWLFSDMDKSRLKGINLGNLGKIRSMTETLCNSSDTVIRKSVSALYPDLGDLSSVILTEEIIADRIPARHELKKRYKDYFFSNGQLYPSLTKENFAKKFDISFQNQTINEQTTLKGSVAQQGRVKGYVRRLMGHSKIDEVRDGEIIISPMTIPDFLPAMKRAAAFVTDEGGILCHAAIVARELKKPCIVGTTFATQIFKDGDYVEVNAYTGVVKLLKHIDG